MEDDTKKKLKNPSPHGAPRELDGIRRDPCLRWLVLAFVSLLPLAGHSDFEEKAKVDVSAPSYEWSSAIVTYLMSVLLPLGCGAIIDLQGTPLGALLFALLAAMTQALLALALQYDFQWGILVTHSVIRGLGGGLFVANSSILSEYFSKSDFGLAIGLLGSANHLYKWALCVIREVKAHSIGEEEMKWGGIILGCVSVVAGLAYVLTDAVYKRTQVSSRHSAARSPSTGNVISSDRETDGKNRESDGRDGDPCCTISCAMMSIALAQLLYSTSAQSLESLKKKESIEKVSITGVTLLLFNLVVGPVVGAVLDRVGYRMQMSMIIGLFLALAQYFAAFTEVSPITPFFMLSFVKTAAPTVLRSSVPLVVAFKDIGSSFGLFQAFQVTGDYGSQVAAVSFRVVLVKIGLVICGILGFFISLIMAMCPFETIRTLGRPTISYLSDLDFKELIQEKMAPLHEGTEAGRSCLDGCCMPCMQCCSWTRNRCAELCGEIAHFFEYRCFYCCWFLRGIFCCRWRCEEEDTQKDDECVPAYGSFD